MQEELRILKAIEISNNNILNLISSKDYNNLCKIDLFLESNFSFEIYFYPYGWIIKFLDFYIANSESVRLIDRNDTRFDNEEFYNMFFNYDDQYDEQCINYYVEYLMNSFNDILKMFHLIVLGFKIY